MKLIPNLFKSQKQRAIEEYNDGLAAKYRGEWTASLLHNCAAASLNAEDEATWWNLGIAATALRDWPEARRAWKACGIELEDSDGIVSWGVCTACVRLQPEAAAEVVWGDRLDPARIQVTNVPLPTSGRRYKDIVLADGAQNGTRTSNGYDYPVFDELALWQPSSYATYEASLTMTGPNDLVTLEQICKERDCSIEDWGTIRFLCKTCSEGHPGEHTCSFEEPSQGRFGLAVKDLTTANAVLHAWKESNPACGINELQLVVPILD